MSTSYTQDYFVTTWNTQAGTGQTGNTTIMLPITSGRYDVDANGDGIFEMTNLQGKQPIDFGPGNAGMKTIAVRPSTLNATGKLQINHKGGSTPQKLMSIDKWGDIVWNSMASAFRGCSNMTIATDAGVPNLTKVKNMRFIFSGAANFNGDLSAWDVSKVTNMDNMLTGATNFTSENYDALLTGWANLPSLQPNVVFGAPPTTYCNGKAGRGILTGTYNWDISGDTFSCPVAPTAPVAPFVTTWNTENGDNQSGNRTIMLPVTVGTYDVDVNNDGDYDDAIDRTNLTGTQEITLPSAGEHTITIRPNPAYNTDNQLRINHKASTPSTPQKLISIDQWGGIVWTSMENAFNDCSNMTIIKSDEAPDLFMVTNMAAMFSGTGMFNSDLSTWNVSKVTDMTEMFTGATSFNSNLGDWDVSKVTDMTEMFTGATSFKSENYDLLLSGWASLPSLQTNVVFGAPPTSYYCEGKTGRDILINAHSWTITGDEGFDCMLSLKITAFLQGPYDTTDTTKSLMNASLLTAGDQDTNIIPTTSPYEDGAMVESTVFNTTGGNDAIVDWVEILLRDPNDVSMVISTTSALLQRDGDVVALDGSSILQIQGIAGDYKVSINHRNHIPVITDAIQRLSTTNTAIDFTNKLKIVTGGSNAMAEVEVKSDNSKVYALFSGDVNGNGQVQLDDYNAVIQDIGRGGYLTSDVGMNGELQADDINLVLKTLGKGQQF